MHKKDFILYLGVYMKSFLIAATIIFLPFFAGADPTGDNIIFSEVHFDSTSSGNSAEWFELYNPSANTIDISGWTVKEFAAPFFTFPSGTVIESGEYLLVVNDTAAFQIDFPGVTPHVDMSGGGCYSPSSCLRLNNTNDELTLYSGNVGSTVVDYVSWGTGAYADAGKGESIARVNSIDTDTAADWHDSYVPDPAGGTLTAKTPPTSSSGSSRKKKKSSVRFTCKDKDAINYDRFGRHKSSLCKFNSQGLVGGSCADMNTGVLLKKGAKGDRVKKLQSCLRSLELPVVYVDGIFGDKTDLALRIFQKNIGIASDGILGKKTRAAFKSLHQK